MADPEHLAILKQGVEAWNAWRERSGLRPELRGADLSGRVLPKIDLGTARLRKANLRKANFREAKFRRATFYKANLSGADLRGANLRRADLTKANLEGADLRGADLSYAVLVQCALTDARLTGCRVYGASAWDLTLNRTDQIDLIITDRMHPSVTVDSLEIAQFTYLLLHNEKIRDVIDTVGKKGVLLLGRFTEGRLAILVRLRDQLRQRGFLPMVFNFDKPETRGFTETVRVLAGLSRFVIVDITNPRSAPLELQATVPECMIPFVPILERGEEPFSMFQDLWITYRAWVLDPIRYPSVERLLQVLDSEIIGPAEAKFAELMVSKAEKLRIRDI